MQLPVEISYRGVEKSDEIDDLIRSKAARLDRFAITLAAATSRSNNRTTSSVPAIRFASEST